MNARREELENLSVKTGLRPIAKSLRIKNYSSNIKKNLLIDSILEFERLLPNIEIPISEINKLQSITALNKKRCEELQKLKLEVDFSKMDPFQQLDEMSNIEENIEARRIIKQKLEKFENTNAYQKLRREEFNKLKVMKELRLILKIFRN